MKERIKWIDALKFFAIYLVLWGHNIQYFHWTQAYYDEPIYRIIYSFHMPLFMALSGFFATSLSNKSFITVLRDKFIRLILPIITMACIFILLRIICSQLEILQNKSFINTRPEDGFWFLKSAFICNITFYLVNKSKKYYLFLLVSTLLLSQLFCGYKFYKIDIMYPCFILGAYIKLYLKNIIRYSKSISIITGFVFIILLLFWDASFWSTINIYKEDNNILIVTELFKLIYIKSYTILIGIIGTLFFITLFEYLSHIIPKTIFGEICIKSGSHTLGIYIFQSLIIERLLSGYINLDTMDFFLFNFIITPFLSIVILFVCIGIILLIKKLPLLDFLILGSLKSKKIKSLQIFNY